MGPDIHPHHPLTCATELRLNEDMSMECDHSKAAPDNVRTRAAVTHSIAILILEEAVRRFG